MSQINEFPKDMDALNDMIRDFCENRCEYRNKGKITHIFDWCELSKIGKQCPLGLFQGELMECENKRECNPQCLSCIHFGMYSKNIRYCLSPFNETKRVNMTDKDCPYFINYMKRYEE